MGKLGELVQKPIYSIPQSTDELILPWGKVGIEIETENCRTSNMQQISKHWDIHQDGSLRNHGMEFVTKGGLVGKDIVDALDVFCPWAVKSKLTIGYPRAGIHIHLDCTDMDVGRGDLKTFLALYAILEHTLFGYAGEWRRHCGFCDGISDGRKNLEIIKYLVNEEDIDSRTFVDQLNRYDRYAGLNLQSLNKYGTIEFRHLETTFDTRRILNWINIIFRLKKAAMSWDLSKSILQEFSTLGAEGFCASIMGGEWKHLSPFFNEKQAWYAIDDANYILGKIVPHRLQVVDWDETKPNPILAMKGKRKPASKKDSYGTID